MGFLAMTNNKESRLYEHPAPTEAIYQKCAIIREKRPNASNLFVYWRSAMAALTRKEFLRLAALGIGAVAGGRFLAGCGALPAPVATTQAAEHVASNSPAPTDVPTDTSIPSRISFTPTSTQPLRGADIIKFFPTVPSRVVHTHHRGVWDEGTLQPGALEQMLDASITKLTGISDASTAWQALFAPSERIAIKVNTLQYGRFWTHVPLVMAVAERLQAAGIPAGQIVIYDRSSNDLAGGGFTINQDGPGVRCYGTDLQYESGWKIADTSVRLSSILLGCDALIDMPILKTHSMDGAGMSFAMKNHYGTFDQPQNFHYDKLLQGLPELNALPPIKERTRLIIGDALKIVQDNWNAAFDSDFICMSFDPVAHDTLGLQILNNVQAANGIETEPTRARAAEWLKNAAALGLGTDQRSNIEFLEEQLS
jgi:hypothetical protein